MEGLHGICLDNSNVEALLVIIPNRVYLLCDKVGDCVTNFHAKDKFVREFFLQLKHQTSIATPNVHNSRCQGSLMLFLLLDSCLFSSEVCYWVLIG